jgi:hypothetical protein
VPAAVGCLEWCEVTNRRTVLESSSAHPDSALAPAFLAGFDAATDAGALLQLRVDEDNAWWSAVGDGPGVIVTTSYWTQEISLAALRQGAVAIGLPVGERLQVSLGLSPRVRDRAPRAPTMSVRFAGVRLIRSRRPYGSRDGGGAGLAAATAGGYACAIPLPGSVCNVSGSVSPTPYTFLPSAWGVTGFASNSSSSASVPMTITLSGLVDEFGIWVHDPDFDGNWVIAYDDQMTPLDSAAVPYDGVPGVENFTSEEITVGGPGIKYIKLQPAPLDYVAYGEAGFPEPDTLVVACTNWLFRGEAGACTATSGSGTGTVHVSDWLFVNGGPALDASDSISQATMDTVWSGPFVRGGIVYVTGSVNGVPDTASAPLHVRARKWGRDTVDWYIANLGTADLPDPPPAPNPQTPNVYDGLGVTRLRADIMGNTGPGAPTVEQVLSGPNEGLLYFSRMPTFAAGSTKVNYAALSPGGTFHGQHAGSIPPGCSQANLTAFIPLVEQHEGTQLDPGSHTATLRVEANGTTAFLTALEPFVAQTVSWFQNQSVQLIQPSALTIMRTASDSGKWPEAVVKPVPWGCTFIF